MPVRVYIGGDLRLPDERPDVVHRPPRGGLEALPSLEGALRAHRDLIARYLGEVRPERCALLDDRLVVGDERATLELFTRSASLRWRLDGWSERAQRQVGAPAAVAEADAAQVARRFAAEHELLPHADGVTWLAAAPTSCAVAVGTAEGRTELRRVATQVSWSCDLRGARVLAPGAKAQVTVAASGEVVECLCFWRDIDERGAPAAQPPISEAELRAAVVRSVEREFAPLATDSEVTFASTHPAYVTRPPREAQKTFPKALALRGVVTDERGERRPYIRFLSRSPKDDVRVTTRDALLGVP